MGIISWILLGAVAGFLANVITGGGEGLIGLARPHPEPGLVIATIVPSGS